MKDTLEDTPMSGGPLDPPGLNLLDRLDLLRGFLMEARKASSGDVVEEIDQHLATLDDASEALQA